METNTNTTQDTILESTKTANKWMNDAVNSMMDIYKKQLNVMSNFYSNFFNVFTEDNRNMFNPAKSFSDLFMSGNGGSRSANMFAPQSNGNVLAQTMDKVFRQMSEFNQNLANAFTKQVDNGNMDWNQINEKYQRLNESRFEAAKKIMNSIVQINNKQLELSIESNKTLQEEINNQLNFINKQNQKFWSDLMNMRLASTSERHTRGDGSTEKRHTKSTVEVES